MSESHPFWNSPRFLVALVAGIAAASFALGLSVGLAPESGRLSLLHVSAASAVPSAGSAGTSAAPVEPSAAPRSTALARKGIAAPGATPPVAPRATTPTTAAPSAVTPKASTPKATASKPTAPKATAPKATAPKATKKPAPRKPPATGPTDWAALNAAIARIPGYRQGAIRWSVSSRYGHYGTTDLATSHIYITPYLEPSLLDSVVRHEYAHVVSVRAYGGDWRAAKVAMNAAFGGSGMAGAERAADCMARALGATWLHHTSCRSGAWQALAARLLSGQPV